MLAAAAALCAMFTAAEDPMITEDELLLLGRDTV
jgi:hypothetical protein